MSAPGARHGHGTDPPQTLDHVLIQGAETRAVDMHDMSVDQLSGAELRQTPESVPIMSTQVDACRLSICNPNADQAEIRQAETEVPVRSVRLQAG